MRSIITFLTAALLAAAAPAPPAFIWTPSPTSLQTCTSATFSTLTDAPPASWNDCAALYSSWASINGSFTISSTIESFVPILKSDSCTLALKPDVTGERVYRLGDEDVAAILEEALKDFSSGSLVGAKGGVVCEMEGGKNVLDWQLFDSQI